MNATPLKISDAAKRDVRILFIAKHALPASEVLIVDPNRGNRAAFSKRMAGMGYALSDRSIKSIAGLGVAAYSGRLLHYRRSYASLKHRC